MHGNLPSARTPVDLCLGLRGLAVISCCFRFQLNGVLAGILPVAQVAGKVNKLGSRGGFNPERDGKRTKNSVAGAQMSRTISLYKIIYYFVHVSIVYNAQVLRAYNVDDNHIGIVFDIKYIGAAPVRGNVFVVKVKVCGA